MGFLKNFDPFVRGGEFKGDGFGKVRKESKDVKVHQVPVDQLGVPPNIGESGGFGFGVILVKGEGGGIRLEKLECMCDVRVSAKIVGGSYKVSRICHLDMEFEETWNLIVRIGKFLAPYPSRDTERICGVGRSEVGVLVDKVLERLVTSRGWETVQSEVGSVFDDRENSCLSLWVLR